MTTEKIAIVIPALNEEAALRLLLADSSLAPATAAYLATMKELV